MKLIKAQQSDATICMNMIQDFYQIDNYPFDEPKAMRCFNEMVNNHDLGRFWLIQSDSQIIGYLILCFGFSFEYGGRDAFIDELYLVPNERSKGIGTQVLTLLCTEAEKLNIKAIHLEVEKTNSVGKKLYEKVGYQGKNRSLLTQIID